MLETQVGALPIRTGRKGKVRILLVTARNKDRWIIPKGHRSKKLSDRKAAAREAREEAGVRGKIGKRLGSYVHTKRGQDAATIKVYMLDVREDTKAWIERDARKRKWVSPEKACRLVRERDLRKLIAIFS